MYELPEDLAIIDTIRKRSVQRTTITGKKLTLTNEIKRLERLEDTYKECGMSTWVRNTIKKLKKQRKALDEEPQKL